jgi:O-antigen/teichoic acid export membrane protein
MIPDATDTPFAVEERKSSFRGDVLRLVSGTALAQLIVLSATPVLARLFAPEAFGVAAMFMALTSVAGVVACLRYELSIVLPESDREAANLLALSLLIALAVSLLVSLVVWLWGPVILSWVSMSELAPYLCLVPVYILVQGIFLSLNYWNTRTKHFTRLAVSRLTGSIANTSGSMAAGFLGHATGGALVAAQVGGQAVAAAALGGQIWRNDGRFLASNIDVKEILRGLSRYRKFPLLSSWPALMNSLSWQLPALMLGAFFNPVVVGMYALGLRVINTPMGLVSGAVSQVLYRRTAELKHTAKLAEVVSCIYRQLLSIALVPCLVLMLTGQELFGFVFGNQWREAGLYAQILAPWAALWFASSPLSVVYIALEQQQKEGIIQLIILSSRAGALLIGGLCGSPVVALVMFSFSGFLGYAYVLSVVFKTAKLQANAIWRASAGTLTFSLLIIQPLLWMVLSGSKSVTVMVIAVTTLVLHAAYTSVDVRRNMLD